jgi:heme exporter protein D
MYVLAYDLFDIFWTMLYFFLFFLWIWIAVSVLIDIFRSDDMGGWAKALWVIFVIFLPMIGVLVYIIARGKKMHEHAQQQVARQQEMFNAAVRNASGSGGGLSTADELEKLANLKASGAITEEDFNKAKTKLIG